MQDRLGFPTILVADLDNGVQHPLVRDLQQQGYFVLVAQDSPEAIEITRVHSRPIHVMLTAESMDGRALAATVKQYRPKMSVFFVSTGIKPEAPGMLRLDTTLDQVRELFQPPALIDIGVSGSRRPPGHATLPQASHSLIAPGRKRDSFPNS